MTDRHPLEDRLASLRASGMRPSVARLRSKTLDVLARGVAAFERRAVQAAEVSEDLKSEPRRREQARLLQEGLALFQQEAKAALEEAESFAESCRAALARKINPTPRGDSTEDLLRGLQHSIAVQDARRELVELKTTDRERFNSLVAARIQAGDGVVFEATCRGLAPLVLPESVELYGNYYAQAVAPLELEQAEVAEALVRRVGFDVRLLGDVGNLLRGRVLQEVADEHTKAFSGTQPGLPQKVRSELQKAYDSAKLSAIKLPERPQPEVEDTALEKALELAWDRNREISARSHDWDLDAADAIIEERSAQRTREIFERLEAPATPDAAEAVETEVA